MMPYMTVKFSDLRLGALINHDGEVITKEQAIKIIKLGQQRTELRTVSPNWIQQALKSAWRDTLEEVEDENYTAPDPDSELIEIDRLE
jgi:hypothetical protein